MVLYPYWMSFFRPAGRKNDILEIEHRRQAKVVRLQKLNLQFAAPLLLALQELIFSGDVLKEALGVAALGQA